MKRFMLFVAALVLFCMSVFAAEKAKAAAPVVKTVVAIADANVRDIPAVNGSQVVGKLALGDSAIVKEEFCDWYQVKTSKGVTGYVYGLLLDRSTWIVLGKGASVLAESKTASKSLGVVQAGEKVTVIGGTTTWYRIADSPQWVSAGFVKVK